MNPYRYQVALRATHPSDDLKPLFEAIGLRPTRAWRAGEPRRTPAGHRLEGAYPDSYASASLLDQAAPRGWTEEPLEAFLRRQLDRLAPHQPAFQALASQGGRCELFIGLFADNSFGFDLGNWLCEATARLRLSLAFDIHPGAD
ncbi:hypothetical protein [Marilutibacter alkalisoli]|uniref:DUF4279 domain-containing protein n=1 Tax=Marilutibacter alkalisoli TaxID=2591633 RepID=A0A514BX42_9GAMM|nr:hypothetical protein [Lysobacter alkalisoli]QDH71559.1 hypothetical protein FKV23_16745 [Lysobacter alkalisoli]